MLLSIARLNEHLLCKICDGYYREAHTISECLHTFCKVCLLREFHEQRGRGAKSCPTCAVHLGANPEARCVFDRNLQSIVDKVFPEYAEREKREGSWRGGVLSSQPLCFGYHKR